MAVTIALRSDIPAKVQRILLPTSITLVGLAMGVSLYLHQAEYSSTTPFMQSVGYSLIAVGFGCLLLWLYQSWPVRVPYPDLGPGGLAFLQGGTTFRLFRNSVGICFCCDLIAGLLCCGEYQLQVS